VVGVSNHSTAQLDEPIQATGQAPQVNQIPWAPALHDGARLVEHRQRGVVLEGYSPFTSTDLGDPVLAEVAAGHGVSPAQVVLRWHLEHGVVVIPRSATRERIAANLDVFGFALTEEEQARIDRLSTSRMALDDGQDGEQPGVIDRVIAVRVPTRPTKARTNRGRRWRRGGHGPLEPVGPAVDAGWDDVGQQGVAGPGRASPGRPRRRHGGC
jgi:Aldo/keto reductase family